MLNIALNTFKEIVRNKFLYLIVFFAGIFTLFSLALGKLTIGESQKVIVDFGLSMIEIFGLIGVLFVGSQLLFKEIEGKTIFLILSKPIKRQDFILGKFFGFSATILLIVFFQALLFLGVLFFQGIPITSLILWTVLFTFLKLEILLAIVFFFSTFMSTIMTIMVSLMVYLISHSFSLIIDLFVRMQDMILVQSIRIFQLIFPPLEALNIKDVIGTFSEFSLRFFLYNSVYSLLYICIILFFTVQIFSRKTFEN
ncbi:ABC transporter permease [Candidatus Gracilibacteria bacterium]|nr:ABC transporter permease [Candidatus Gracilibacteria bacterium]